jgi:hypothetical protein
MANWRHTDAAKQKIREKLLGTKRPESTKAKIKATLRRKWDLIKQLDREAQQRDAA